MCSSGTPPCDLPVASSATAVAYPILQLNLGDAVERLSSAQQEMAGEATGVTTKLDQFTSDLFQLVEMQHELMRQQCTTFDVQHQQGEMLAETARQQIAAQSGCPASSKPQTKLRERQLTLNDTRGATPQVPAQHPITHFCSGRAISPPSATGYSPRCSFALELSRSPPYHRLQALSTMRHAASANTCAALARRKVSSPRLKYDRR